MSLSDVSVGETFRRSLGVLGRAFFGILTLIDGAEELDDSVEWLSESTGEELSGDRGSDAVLGQMRAVYEEKSDAESAGAGGGLCGVLCRFWHGRSVA